MLKILRTFFFSSKLKHFDFNYFEENVLYRITELGQNEPVQCMTWS